MWWRSVDRQLSRTCNSRCTPKPAGAAGRRERCSYRASSLGRKQQPSWRPCRAMSCSTGSLGSTGLPATLAALEAGRILALANKESLVVGGPLVTQAAKPGQIVAVDSEHSALAQCLRGGAASEVDRLILTASGGPFRGLSREQMRDVTPNQALAHPTWNMGRVITTNSATLVNKGWSCWRPTCCTAWTWTGSMSSSTLSRSCIPWCSSLTGLRSRSARRRI